MKKSSKIMGISFLVLSIAVSVIFFTKYSANAEAVKIRLGGTDRYGTAVETSKRGWGSGSSTIVLVCGSDYPDALSAAPLAKSYNAPILLTEKGGLSGVVSTEISRLNPTKAYIVGGTGVISANVESQLKAKGISDTQRIGGVNRYETAALVASEVVKKVGTCNGIVLASGTGFADALSIAPIAAKLGMPILLTEKNDINSYNKSFIQNNAIPITYVIGGTGVISDSNKNNYANAIRIGGVDRYKTNTLVLQTFKNNINVDKIYLASGGNFPDGLVGAPIAALTSAPIVLIEESGSYYPSTLEAIKGYKSSQVLILGGTGVISDNIANKVIEAANYEEVFKVLSID